MSKRERLEDISREQHLQDTLQKLLNLENQIRNGGPHISDTPLDDMLNEKAFLVSNSSSDVVESVLEELLDRQLHLVHAYRFKHELHLAHARDAFEIAIKLLRSIQQKETNQ